MSEIKNFPGLFPVSVLHYSGLVEGHVKRRKGRETISWSLGPPLRVTPGAARGEVEHVSPKGKALAVSGWALDGAHPQLADWILLFSGDRLLLVTPGGIRRPDIAQRYGRDALLSGFFIPSSEAADRSGLRVFAVVGDRASRLPLSRAARRSLG